MFFSCLLFSSPQTVCISRDGMRNGKESSHSLDHWACFGWLLIPYLPPPSGEEQLAELAELGFVWEDSSRRRHGHYLGGVRASVLCHLKRWIETRIEVLY